MIVELLPVMVPPIPNVEIKKERKLNQKKFEEEEKVQKIKDDLQKAKQEEKRRKSSLSRHF